MLAFHGSQEAAAGVVVETIVAANTAIETTAAADTAVGITSAADTAIEITAVVDPVVGVVAVADTVALTSIHIGDMITLGATTVVIIAVTVSEAAAGITALVRETAGGQSDADMMLMLCRLVMEEMEAAVGQSGAGRMLVLCRQAMEDIVSEPIYYLRVCLTVY